ncbi:MAG: tRNA pseudouridine(55) synthase TruB [bacterium]
MNGILLIDKPEGWSSFDCVAKIRSFARIAESKKVKVGHAGTLDPLASGLMILLIGSFTKKADYLTKKDKTYEVKMRLGVKSSTGDEEGEKLSVSDEEPSEEKAKQAIACYIGKIDQIPPAYSAIKINGVRSYKLAREGKAVELKSRPVEIYSIDKVIYEYPYISFTTRVSSGTYIRSLVNDIGEKLGVGAYTTHIRRTSIADYDISKSHAISDIDSDNLEQKLITQDINNE